MRLNNNQVVVVIAMLLIITSGAGAQHFGSLLNDTPGMVSYTYRNSFKVDVAATLDTIRSMGVTNIEFSNLFGRTAKDIRTLLDERNMRCTSFGVSYAELTTKLDEVGENAKTLGASFVRVAWIPHEGTVFSPETAKTAAADFNKAGQRLIEKYGLTFCYHNHGYEFSPYGKGTLFDFLAEQTDPKFVSFEMDILWTFHGGQDPAALLHKYRKRFKLMHIKDLRKGVAGDFTGGTSTENDVALGKGQINIPAVLKAAKGSSIVYYYLEDESKSVKTQVPMSLAYLEEL